ncbi:hypothetical protein L6164_036170 [Bauhinia variegata]|uniref:Uncharacterized protein n=1 Tax=Bauhinia variegata TaxID=167791 RepID=A0ACB9KG67_BAUVA|nr:hypothetical protein L6164_036170 [Bauhinia variegata]
MSISSKLPNQLNIVRTFVNARVKWVRDPYLDTAVQKEKNLKQVISLKNQIISSPSESLPLSTASLLKTPFNLPTTTAKFMDKYHFVFAHFQSSPRLHPHVRLTPRALALHREEMAIHDSPTNREDTVQRLAKLLMLADPSTGKELLALELVSWRKELATSELEKRVMRWDCSGQKGSHNIAFPMSLPKGFDLEKKVKNWVEEWQALPYISPYENAFHLEPNSDLGEKWIVAILHELLWLLVSKKTEGENLLYLGEFLGLGSRFKKALAHHPGIFYRSNKIRTQTVVLREAYRKDFLVEKHPLMGMRHRYIHLMTKANKKGKPATIVA